MDLARQVVCINLKIWLLLPESTSSLNASDDTTVGIVNCKLIDINNNDTIDSEGLDYIRGMIEKRCV